MLGKRKKLSAQEQAFQQRVHQKEAYLKTQQRLKAIHTYLENMQTMLRDSATMLAAESYPTEGLTWLIEKGLPTIEHRIIREQHTLQNFIEKQPKN